MNNKISYLETKKRKYPMVFNINVLEELQTEYGSFQKWGDVVKNDETGEPNIKDLKKGLMLMINEGIDIENEDKEDKEEFVNDKQLGRIISEVGTVEILEAINNLTKSSTNTDSEIKNE